MRHALMVLSAIALAAPLAIDGQCALADPSAVRPATAALLAAPPRLAIQSGFPASRPYQPRDFMVDFPFPNGPPVKPGWGLFAVVHGRSMDLNAGGGWTMDSDAGPHEMEIGYGWRRSRVSAIVGYVQPDYGRPEGVPLRHGPSGVLGLNFTLYSR